MPIYACSIVLLETWFCSQLVRDHPQRIARVVCHNAGCAQIPISTWSSTITASSTDQWWSHLSNLLVPSIGSMIHEICHDQIRLSCSSQIIVWSGYNVLIVWRIIFSIMRSTCVTVEPSGFSSKFISFLQYFIAIKPAWCTSSNPTSNNSWYADIH